MDQRRGAAQILLQYRRWRVFKDQRLLVAELSEHQTRVIGAHATGVGEPFPTEVVRAMMLP